MVAYRPSKDSINDVKPSIPRPEHLIHYGDVRYVASRCSMSKNNLTAKMLMLAPFR